MQINGKPLLDQPVFIGMKMTLILSRLQTIAVAGLVLVCLHFSGLNQAWSKNNGRKIMPDVVSVECVNQNQADAALFKVICGELMQRLEAMYPAVRFDQSRQSGKTTLRAIIHTANASNLSMQLIWTSQSGQISKGEQLSISIMDKSLNASRRGSLYYRLLAETPMPNMN